MPDDKKVVEIAEEPKPQDDITIELDEKNEPIKQTEVKKEEPKYNPDEIKKLTEEAVKKATAPLYYELREFKKKQQEAPAPIAKKEPEPEQDEWDIKFSKDYKSALREFNQQQFKELRQAEIEQARVQSEQQRVVTLLDNNKKKVMEKHPELNDIASEKYQLFEKAVKDNPAYRDDPFGPVLAMRDMEEELRSSGRLDESTKKIMDKEISRIARTNGATVPAGSSQSSNKIVLTKDERDLCDRNGWKYESYISTKKKLSNGGIEV